MRWGRAPLSHYTPQPPPNLPPLFLSLGLPGGHHHKLDGPALEAAGHEWHDEGALGRESVCVEGEEEGERRSGVRALHFCLLVLVLMGKIKGAPTLSLAPAIPSRLLLPFLSVP